MEFLCRRSYFRSVVRAYSTSMLSKESSASVSPAPWSREAFSLLKSETNPHKILDICRSSTFDTKCHTDRAVIVSTVSNISKLGNPSDIKSLIDIIIPPNPHNQRDNALKIALFGKANLVDEAISLFHEIHKPGARGSVKCLNALIHACILGKDLDGMKRVYSEFPSLYNVKPNVDTYNRVIKGLCRSKNASAAYLILNEMKEKKVNPNAATFATIFEGLSADENDKEVGNLLSLMKDKNNFHLRTSVYNARIKSLCKAKRAADALKLLDEMRVKCLSPNATTYKELILGFCMEGNLEKAKRLFDDMVGCNLMPSSEMYFTLVHFFAEGGDLENALIFCNQSMGEGWVPKYRTMKTLINNLINVGKVEEARMLLAVVKGKVKKKWDLWEEIESRFALS